MKQQNNCITFEFREFVGEFDEKLPVTFSLVGWQYYKKMKNILKTNFSLVTKENPITCTFLQCNNFGNYFIHKPTEGDFNTHEFLCKMPIFNIS
jgi:hypothetical protein